MDVAEDLKGMRKMALKTRTDEGLLVPSVFEFKG